MDIIKIHEKRKNIKIISVEGNISVGKSSFLKSIEKLIGNKCKCIYEPVDQWADMLQQFYENPKRNAAMFQVYVTSNRIKHVLSEIVNSDKTFFIIERCPPLSDYRVFTRYNYELGNITDFEFKAYEELYWSMFDIRELIKPDHIIYLKADPTICLTRLKLRNRKGEEKISLDYLEGLERKHEDFLCNGNYGLEVSIVNNDLDNIPNIDEIISFIMSI